MSAIGAIFNLDRAPVTTTEIGALSEDLTNRANDADFQYVSQDLAMCYRPFHTTKESWNEKQPLVSPHGDVFVMDGIIFNREELIDLLHCNPGDDRTDAGLVNAGLQIYGPSFFQRIIGDYALIWWKARTRVLFLARDPFGVRPLYYHLSPQRLIAASNLEALLELSNGKKEIDEEYVAGYLALFPAPERTPYKDFFALPPGYFARLEDGQLKLCRFWGPDPCKEINYKTDAEYEEHLLDLLRGAVRCCLRTDGRPIWSNLSGGLDSSSIVCLADQLIERGDAEASKLETFSVIYRESVMADESKYIRAVEERRGKVGYHFYEDEHWMTFPPPEKVRLCLPSPQLCIPERSAQLRQAMRNAGARVLLDGNGGDQVFWNAPDASPELADLLIRGKLLHLHAQLRVWSLCFNLSYMNLLWQQAILPLLPRRIRARCHKGRTVTKWFDKRFVTRRRLLHYFLYPPDPFGFRLPGSRMRSGSILHSVHLIASGIYQERESIEMRYPLLHRPLVEFLLAVPFGQILRPGESRSLMRRALCNVVPERILRRKSKGVIGEVISHGVSKEWLKLKPLLTDARVCSLGYVDANAMQAAFKLFLHGGEVNAGSLLKIISLEMWLRSAEHNGIVRSNTLNKAR